MRRTIKELKGFKISARDGIKGTVKDFLFDEESWTIRYMVADLGNILPGRKVLIPRVFLESTNWDKNEFSVALTKQQIIECPELAEHMPVSREYEAKLYNHYDIEYYWPLTYTAPMGMVSGVNPPSPLQLNVEIVGKNEIDSNLRSFNEVKDYKIDCLDKSKGHLKNFIVDDETWQIVYLIIDVSHWYTVRKNLMVSSEWMRQISYIDKSIQIDLDSKTLEEAPDFDPNAPVNAEYEQQLFDYYGRRVAEV